MLPLLLIPATLLDADAVRAALEAAQPRALWHARVNPRVSGLSMLEVQQTLLGVLGTAQAEQERVVAQDLVERADEPPLPADFDWRRSGNETFDSCVGPVVDQGHCGSCWAVSAAESFADRLCIGMRRSNSSVAPRIDMSSLDLIACDHLCEGVHCNHGCQGGYPPLAWKFIKEKGIVDSECMPYNLSKQLLCPVPKCRPPAIQAVHKVRAYKHVVGGADAIRRELVNGGPVQAQFTVYEDFMSYGSGIYHHVTGRRVGEHAVKVVGFGVGGANATEFWECQNSWGGEWGTNGTFRIAVGQCGFELNVLSGDPCLPHSYDPTCFAPP